MINRRSRIYTAAILGLAGLIANHGRSAAPKAEDRIVLTLPGISWALKIEEPSFVVVAKDLDPDGNGIKLKAEDTGNQITISAFIEKAVAKGGAAACRDYHWWQTRKVPLDLEDARLFETGPLAVVEFNIPKVAATELNQKHVHAYLARDGYWMGVEITRNFHKPEQDPILHSILEHIAIDTAYIPTIQEQFGHARFYYLKRDYRKAAESYAEILERTGPGSSLNRDSWRVLVNQLGMSYGQSGEPAKTRDLLLWAIPNDPEYPLFHYILACAYAEIGDPDSALEQLRLAYRYKANLRPGETFPDPRKDPSFKKLRKDKRFGAELDKLK
jgi:tetratricopeptide (TPR) repeat protein